MKRYALLACMNLLLAVQTGFTQETQDVPKKVNYTIGTGLALPASPSGFSDYYQPGFNVNWGLEYPFDSKQRFLLNIYSAYNRFSLNKGQVASDIGVPSYAVSGGSSSVWAWMLGMKFRMVNQEDKNPPYALLGIGTATISSSNLEIQGRNSGSERSTRFGISFGTGFEITRNFGAIVIEGRDVLGFLEDGEVMQVLTFSVGLIFR